MKKSKFIFLIGILLPIPFTNSSCTKECNDALAELTTQIAITGVQTIFAGQPFKIPNLIKNALATVNECKDDISTIRAGRSQSKLKIDYDASNNKSFSKNEVDSNFDVPEIDPGSEASENYNFSFDEPGDYRLITFADTNNNVAEGDEDNNASAPEEVASGKLLTGKIRKPLIIRVLPNPKFKRAEGAPFVRLLSRTVEIK